MMTLIAALFRNLQKREKVHPFMFANIFFNYLIKIRKSSQELVNIIGYDCILIQFYKVNRITEFDITF